MPFLDWYIYLAYMETDNFCSIFLSIKNAHLLNFSHWNYIKISTKERQLLQEKEFYIPQIDKIIIGQKN